MAMKYDYGQRDSGLSFEHCNFFDALEAEGHEIIYFDFMTLWNDHGREEMNRQLLEIARREKPDLMFTVLFRDELDPGVVRTISTELPTVTLNWFCDDHWRFESFSSRWASSFNWVVTTASSAVPKYEQIGYRNVIKSQWACNTHLYRKLDLPPTYDVSFVGQPHGNRGTVINALRAAGIDVHTWGRGWKTGRLSQEEMIRVFNQSLINLNLPNASHSQLPEPGSGLGLGPRMRKATKQVLDALPLGKQVLESTRHRRQQLEARPREADASAAELIYPEQIKGRTFEVPGCGGFLLTGPADDVGQYYEPGREIAVFHGLEDLIDQVRHYLAHEDERLRIAAAGHARTLRDHTYRQRFAEIFAAVGLSSGSRGTSLHSGETRSSTR